MAPVSLNTAGPIDLTKTMRIEYIMSLQFFADMRSFANDLLAQGNVSYEFYYSEIMGISLVCFQPTSYPYSDCNRDQCAY